MKKVFFLFLMSLFLPNPLWAEGEYVEKGGLYYFLDRETRTAGVAQPLGVCQGDAVSVPEKMTHEGTEYAVTGIAERAFRDCKGMYSLTLPKSLRQVEQKSFEGCAGLAEIVLPGNVRQIGAAAFHGCKQLREIKLESRVPIALSEKETPFDSRHYQSVVLVVPNGTVDAYKSSAVWKEFATIRESDVNAVTPPVHVPQASSVVYDLNGVRVLPQRDAQQGAAKGIYIVNGKKMYLP